MKIHGSIPYDFHGRSYLIFMGKRWSAALSTSFSFLVRTLGEGLK